MKKQFRLFVFVAALVAAALACATPGGDPADATPTTTPEIAAEESAEPEDISGEATTKPEDPGDPVDGDSGITMPGETIDLDDLTTYTQPSAFNTYKATMLFDFESIDANPVVTGTVKLQAQHSEDPLEESMIFETSGNAVLGDEGVFTFVTKDNIQYIDTASTGCISSVAGGFQLNPFATFLDDGGLLTGEVNQIGEDEINGIPVYVYDVTQENIDIDDAAGSDVTEISDGKLYVAKDGAYIVRVTLDGTGTSDVLSQNTTLEGNITYQLDFFEFDSPVDVVPPPACTAPEETADIPFPVPDDATEIETQLGFYHFFTGLSLEETVNFYLENMANEGWTLVSSETSPEFATMNYSHSDGSEFSFIFAPADNNKTEVTVIDANPPVSP